MVIGHRVGEVTRVRTDRPRRPPNAFECDRSHGGRRSHLRATEPQRNLFPLHGNILSHSTARAQLTRLTQFRGATELTRTHDGFRQLRFVSIISSIFSVMQSMTQALCNNADTCKMMSLLYTSMVKAMPLPATVQRLISHSSFYDWSLPSVRPKASPTTAGTADTRSS